MHIAPIIALAAAHLLLWAGVAAAQSASVPSPTPAQTAPSPMAQTPVVAHVVQAVGQAQLDGQPVRNGAPVRAGQWLSTGPDGHLYLQTTDQGFIILRPGSRLWLAHYHIDAADPARSRIRLELQRGLVRHISGQAAQAARGQFRFNTPVAAIGIIGTDFTVFSTEHLSRVAVESGAVQVSAFGNGCIPDGWGPCMGPFSLPLQASQAGQVLHIERGQSAPQLRTGPVQPLVPEAAPAPTLLLGPPAVPPAVLGAAAPAVAAPPAPPALLWGRWQALAQPGAEQPGELDLQAAQRSARLYGLGSHFAVLRRHDSPWLLPSQTQVNFELRGHQAVVGPVGAAVAAQIESGTLQFDFIHMRFSTQLQLQAGPERADLRAAGSVAPNGQFDALPRHFDGSNMFVSGVLASPAGGPLQAGYVFEAFSPSGAALSGVTFWQQPSASAR